MEDNVTPSGPDPIALLLQDKRSDNTRRAYAGDLRAFFSGEPAPAEVLAFVQLPVPQIAVRLARWKAKMLKDGKAEATVNRRLAAVKALLAVCYRLGLSQTDGRKLVDGERVTGYRDTAGITVSQMAQLVRAPKALSVAGFRDRAILRLLCENGLRRAEVAALDVADFDPRRRRVQILGKGRGTQKESLGISKEAAGAISLYLKAARHRSGALFINVARNPHVRGERLTGTSLYRLVQSYGALIGEPDLTPHMLRHAAITALLDATDGDVRRVQRYSRHKSLGVLVTYDDRRRDDASGLTETLSGLLEG